MGDAWHEWTHLRKVRRSASSHTKISKPYQGRLYHKRDQLARNGLPLLRFQSVCSTGRQTLMKRPLRRLDARASSRYNPQVSRLSQPIIHRGADDPHPVSYTHLDVYKRQLLESVPEGASHSRKCDAPSAGASHFLEWVAPFGECPGRCVALKKVQRTDSFIMKHCRRVHVSY